MGDQYPQIIREPSVKKTNRGNGNTDALAQWALLWVVPFVVGYVMGLPLFAPLVAVTWLAVRAVYPKAETPPAT